ncbi:MAG: hypothetical protein JWO63_871 [Frankiales bacterium]|jgi:hypothetical protein|nr:hypothetical protein [Frankiales bacterium]
MTRRRTAWWSGIVATSPATLLKRAEGDRLLGVLADWWIAEEGLLEDRPSPTAPGRRAVSRRYHRAEFYARLAESGFPELPDRDEHAIDTVLRVFHGWASSREAGDLIVAIAHKQAARQKVLGGRSTAEGPVGLGHFVHERSQDEFASLVTYEVYEQVQARVRAQIHVEVKAHLRAQ